jgi:mannose-1-phosphate guanylyltransferase
MTHHSTGNPYWSVILAGGDGNRLLPLTRLVTGDDRPKQFCPLMPGGKTLLAETRARTARFSPPDRTLFVLNQVHEPFYSSELADVSPELMVVQPENRGTLPAIVAGLARIMEFDQRAIVGFFPSDHHYSREDRFVAGARRAFRAVRSRSNALILLGAKATLAEPGYGYIEPLRTNRSRTRTRLQPVCQFWEKPATPLAETLRERGCLWNTFVMMGRASAFLDLIRTVSPSALAPFEAVPLASRRLDQIYPVIETSDFSKQVLAKGCSALSVLDIGETGWSDLGDPQRVVATLAMRGVKNPWRDLWVREMGIAAVAN